MKFDNVTPYPEWRQFAAALEPLVRNEGRTQFSYDDLKALGGTDVRAARGRAQFYRFRRMALKEWQVWFENVPSFGYVVIPPADHPKAAIKRVKHARRKVTTAKAIVALAKTDGLTPDQRALQAQTAAMLHTLGQTFGRVSRAFNAAACKLGIDVSMDQLKRIGAPLKKESALEEMKRIAAPVSKPKPDA